MGGQKSMKDVSICLEEHYLLSRHTLFGSLRFSIDSFNTHTPQTEFSNKHENMVHTQKTTVRLSRSLSLSLSLSLSVYTHTHTKRKQKLTTLINDFTDGVPCS